VLFVYGPSGSGKTTLLHELVYLSREAGCSATYLNLREIEPGRSTMIPALEELLRDDPPKRQVLLLDHYERAAAIDTWMWEQFLPQLPDGTLLVLASRRAPSHAWQTDPALRSLTRSLPLSSFNEVEARRFLQEQGVPVEHQQSVLDFTHGNPLALSLLAEPMRNGSGGLTNEVLASISSPLLERFLEEAPEPARRAALEASATVRVTSESLLAALIGSFPESLGTPEPVETHKLISRPLDVHGVFQWLKSLLCVTVDASGLYPDELTREVLLADLRWRNPERLQHMRRAARKYYTLRLLNADPALRRRLLHDYLYIFREHPAIGPYLNWQDPGGLSLDAFRSADQPVLEAMTMRSEASLVGYWLTRQPRGTLVVRTQDGAPMGFLTVLSLVDVSAGDRTMDPAVDAAMRLLSERAPVRPDEPAWMVRFWTTDAGQSVSACQTLLFIAMLELHLDATPAVTMLSAEDAERWAPLFQHLDFTCLAEAPLGLFVHDWRVVPPLAWIGLVQGGGTTAPTLRSARPLAVVGVSLNRNEFERAVREALRTFATPLELQDNPLLRSHMVLERAGRHATDAERARALHDIVLESALTLQGSPRTDRFFAVLDHTYFHPAPTHEAAAQQLDIPFGTYRRLLRDGLDRLMTILWQREARFRPAE
ncbi:MAG: hypothetical protein ACYCW6_30865, partial [Candidatus Xenobia bacterium]